MSVVVEPEGCSQYWSTPHVFHGVHSCAFNVFENARPSSTSLHDAQTTSEMLVACNSTAKPSGHSSVNAHTFLVKVPLPASALLPAGFAGPYSSTSSSANCSYCRERGLVLHAFPGAAQQVLCLDAEGASFSTWPSAATQSFHAMHFVNECPTASSWYSLSGHGLQRLITTSRYCPAVHVAVTVVVEVVVRGVQVSHMTGHLSRTEFPTMASLHLPAKDVWHSSGSPCPLQTPVVVVEEVRDVVVWVVWVVGAGFIVVVVAVGFNINCNCFAPFSQSALLLQYNYNEAWW